MRSIVNGFVSLEAATENKNFLMPQYMLARHVFVCVQGEHVVFLDVRQDRYFALECASTAGLGQVVPGWPVPVPGAVSLVRHDSNSTAPVLVEEIDRSALSSVIALLLQKAILVVDPACGKSAQVTVAEPIRGDLVAEGLEQTPRVGPLAFIRFISAALRGRLLLKHQSFESVVARVRGRAERRRRAERATSESTLHALIHQYATLRPFFFAAKDACLLDALCLSEFLAGYAVFPRWVFGVQARPFAAHCWLQLDGIILNDTVDHVRRYTPIMVV